MYHCKKASVEAFKEKKYQRARPFFVDEDGVDDE